MTFALLIVLLVALVVLALVAISDWQQRNRPVSAGFGPANHRSVLIGG